MQCTKTDFSSSSHMQNMIMIWYYSNSYGVIVFGPNVLINFEMCRRKDRARDKLDNDHTNDTTANERILHIHISPESNKFSITELLFEFSMFDVIKIQEFLFWLIFTLHLIPSPHMCGNS